MPGARHYVHLAPVGAFLWHRSHHHIDGSSAAIIHTLEVERFKTALKDPAKDAQFMHYGEELLMWRNGNYKAFRLDAMAQTKPLGIVEL